MLGVDYYLEPLGTAADCFYINVKVTNMLKYYELFKDELSTVGDLTNYIIYVGYLTGNYQDYNPHVKHIHNGCDVVHRTHQNVNNTLIFELDNGEIIEYEPIGNTLFELYCDNRTSDIGEYGQQIVDSCVAYANIRKL